MGRGQKVPALRQAQNRLNRVHRDFLTKFDFADFPRQDEFDFTITGFFIQAHGIKKFLPLRFTQLCLCRQPVAREQGFDLPDITLSQSQDFLR